MKTVTKFSAILAMLFFSLTILPQKVSAQDDEVSFQVFYDQLSPYGTWVDDPNYGYVWIPDVDPGFQPYSTNGHWVYTDYGWTWISNYPWGWAPFHYGRWYDDPTYGSIWIPGNEWGPAWVSWRRANGYYGWAPLGPDVSINIAFSNSYEIPYNRWVFVRERNLYRDDINRYYVDRSSNVTIINNSTIINNTYIDNSRNVTYIAGPDRREVSRKVGRNITPFMLRDNNTPGQKIEKGRVNLYRPKVEPRSGDNKRSAPTQVKTFREVKPAAERRRETKQNITPQGEQNRVVPGQKGNTNQQKEQINQNNNQQRQEQIRREQPNKNNQQKLEQIRKEQPKQEQQRQEQIRKEQPKQNNQQRQQQIRQNQPPEQNQQRQEQIRKEQPQQNNQQRQQQIERKQQPQQNNQQRQQIERKQEPQQNNQQRQQIERKQQPQQNNQQRQQQIEQKQQPQQNNQQRQQIEQKQQPRQNNQRQDVRQQPTQNPPARTNPSRQVRQQSKPDKQGTPPKDAQPGKDEKK